MWSTSVARAWRVLWYSSSCLPPAACQQNCLRDETEPKKEKKETVAGRLVLTYTEEKFKNIIYLSTTMWHRRIYLNISATWYLVCNSNDCGHRMRREYLIRMETPSTIMHHNNDENGQKAIVLLLYSFRHYLIIISWPPTFAMMEVKCWACQCFLDGKSNSPMAPAKTCSQIHVGQQNVKVRVVSRWEPVEMCSIK